MDCVLNHLFVRLDSCEIHLESDVASVSLNVAAVSNYAHTAIPPLQDRTDLLFIHQHLLETEVSALSNAVKDFTLGNDVSFCNVVISHPSNLAFTEFDGKTYDPPFTLLELMEYAIDQVDTTAHPYEHPCNISLCNLQVNTITNSNFPELISAQASIIPSIDNFYQLGDPAHRWIEGHFTAIYADNLSVTDADGTTRRVLLEGDTDTVAWEDVTGKPTLFSGSYNDLADKPTVLSADLTGYATESWVQQQGYISSLPPPPDLTGYATTSYVDASLANLQAPDLTGYATQTWVQSQGYITSVPPPNLTGYATESWVQSQGFLTSSAALPQWASKFDYLNVGPNMDPPVANNFDIIAFDSISPTGDGVYNLGQHLLRWHIVYADNMRVSNGIKFDNNAAVFNGSYPQLRDRPNLDLYASKTYVDSAVANGGASTTWATIDRPSWTNQFDYATIPGSVADDVIVKNSLIPSAHDTWNLGQESLRYKYVYCQSIQSKDDDALRVFETAFIKSGLGNIEARISGGIIEIRLKKFVFERPSQNVSVLSASVYCTLYNGVTLDFAASTPGVQTGLSVNNFTNRFELGMNGYVVFFNRSSIDIVRVALVVRARFGNTERDIHAFSETVTDFPAGYGDWLVGRTKRLGT